MKNENFEKYIGELSPEMQEKARACKDMAELNALQHLHHTEKHHLHTIRELAVGHLQRFIDQRLLLGRRALIHSVSLRSHTAFPPPHRLRSRSLRRSHPHPHLLLEHFLL